MSDDSITFFAIICCAVAFTLGLFVWQPHHDAVAAPSNAAGRLAIVQGAG